MKIIESAMTAITKLMNFEMSSTRKLEMYFKDGKFLSVKKHIKKSERTLEIHTGGYDGTLNFEEGMRWVVWEILDLVANEYLQNDGVFNLT